VVFLQYVLLINFIGFHSINNVHIAVNLPFGGLTVLAVILILGPTPPPPIEEKFASRVFFFEQIFLTRDILEWPFIPRGKSLVGLAANGNHLGNRFCLDWWCSIGGDLF
jgi:hypothetical protein